MLTSKLPTRTLCMRGCNKAQMCGLAKQTVVECHSKCMAAFKGDDEKQKLTLTARGECADRPCGEFMTCANSMLIGAEAVASAPPVAPEVAKPMCETLCHKEQTCNPEMFAQRRRGMDNCLKACTLAMVSEKKAAAVSRALLNRASACASKPCDEFEACRHPASPAK